MARSVFSLVVGGIVLALYLGSAAPASAQQWQDHEQRALRSLQSGQIEEALTEYSNAYGSGGPKELLLDIGQVYIRLGQPKEARTACQTYLNLVKDAPPARKTAAEQCLIDARNATARTLTPAPPAAVDVPAVPPPAGTPAPPPIQTPPPPPPLTAPPAPSPQTAPAARPTPQAQPVIPPPARPLLKEAPPVLLVQVAPPPPTQPKASPAAAPPPDVAPGPAAAPPPESPNPYSEYELCLHHQRTGNTTLARECYQHFLPTALRHGGLPEADIGPLLAELTRFPEPAAVYPTPVREERPRRNDGLWGAGLALWLSAMVPPLVMGPLYANPETSDRQAIYYTLMIPVVGPFISGIWLPLAAGNSQVVQYTVPWIVGDGVTQLVGMTLFIIGVQPRPVTARLARVFGNMHITPYANGQAAGLAGTF